jgi:hypothetical protein
MQQRFAKMEIEVLPTKPVDIDAVLKSEEQKLTDPVALAAR